MNSEDLEYKIRKYTTKLRMTRSSDKATYYQKKLQEYHQINQYGGLINDKYDNGAHIIDDLRTRLDNALEKSSTNPKLLVELSSMIHSIEKKLKSANKSGGGCGCASPTSEVIADTVQQFFEKTENKKSLISGASETGDNEEGLIYNGGYLERESIGDNDTELEKKWTKLLNEN